MNYSAGIIPFRFNPNSDKLEFFLGHPGGEYWKNKNYWAYLKGGVEEGENWLEAAKREFEEESGISLVGLDDKEFIPLGTAQQNPQKCVVAYGLEFTSESDGIDIDPSKCYSNMCEDNVTPEIDKYGWFDLETTRRITHRAHLVFYDRIEQWLINDTEFDRG